MSRREYRHDERYRTDGRNMNRGGRDTEERNVFQTVEFDSKVGKTICRIYDKRTGRLVRQWYPERLERKGDNLNG